ncbi:MAG: ERCC4 domain-containing protein [Candidatus Pacearchaeota archaeon]
MKNKKPIFDIFSNNQKIKKKYSEKIKIIVDHREKNSLVISELYTLGIDSEMKQLKVADYIVKGIAVERKTVSDFISSMINRRLLNQLEELKQYSERILIIEGLENQELYSDDESWKGMHPNSIRGFIISILIKHKVPIIFTKDYKDTARFLSVLAKRKPKELPLNISKKSLDKKERLQFILEGFPGIGPKTARKLLKKHKTLKRIFNSSEEVLKDTLGKRAKIFKNIVEREF